MANLTNRMFCLFGCAFVLLASCTSKRQGYDGFESKVYIKKNKDGFSLMRNGEPFFIKGACGKQFFEELKEAGANTVRVYDTTNLKSILDKAQENDLAVIVDIPVPRYAEPDTIFNDLQTMTELLRHTKKFVNTYKHHPALLYWMLGNEINYPNLPGDKNLTEYFNLLIDLVHQEDENHPVSTAVSGFNRTGILAIQTLSGSIDFISINIFGELSSFAAKKKVFSPLWNGPYVFSEFGINGPWEVEETRWQAPIEQTSTKKALLFNDRYTQYIATIEDGRLLGSLFFYWGHKQERTYTWFSTVMEDGRKTQLAFEFEKVWKDKTGEFRGPQIDYALLNGRGAPASVVLAPNEKASAELLLPEDKEGDWTRYSTHWQIRPENWNYFFNEVEERQDSVPNSILSKSKGSLIFATPKKEGPYRLFVTLKDQNNYIATTNIPFYVLDPENGQ